MNTTQQAPRRGFTLIELMVGVVVFAVLAALAVPSMVEFIARKRVQGAVDELLVDFRLAKTAQMAVNTKVIVKFLSNADMTCYSIFEKTTFGLCDCRNTATPVCSSMTATLPREFKTSRFLTENHVTVAPLPTSATELWLDPISGLPLSGTSVQILVSSPQGGAVRVSTNSAGAAQACSVSGHSSAYKPCAP